MLDAQVPKVGDQISHFSAKDENGNLWKLKDHLGKNFLVVYFYPAAMTGGWTKQACGYRDSQKQLKELGAIIIGVSGDAVKNLKLFKEVNSLNFTLLSDAGTEIAKTFGVPVRKGGKITKTIGDQSIELLRFYTPSRWTFILDKNGKIIYRDAEANFRTDYQKVINFLKKIKHNS